MAETNGTSTIEIQLSSALVEKARERAARVGKPLDAYVGELVEQDVSAGDAEDPLAAAVKRMTSRTPEQVLADREKLLRTSRKARPLPEGKTLFDVVEGSWPGDETDEEVREMLEKLS